MNETVSEGSKGQPDRDTIAGTGPGIPDDALGPGRELPRPPTDEDVKRAADQLGASTGERDDTSGDGG